jgi:VanZ family protein
MCDNAKTEHKYFSFNFSIMLPSRLLIPHHISLQPCFWWMAVVLWMGAIFYVSSIPSVATPFEPIFDFTVKKFAHMVEYGTLTLLLFNALQIHFSLKGHSMLTAALIATLYACSDEWHQTFIPGREGTLRDVGIDTLGVLLATLYLIGSNRAVVNPR